MEAAATASGHRGGGDGGGGAVVVGTRPTGGHPGSQEGEWVEGRQRCVYLWEAGRDATQWAW